MLLRRNFHRFVRFISGRQARKPQACQLAAASSRRQPRACLLFNFPVICMQAALRLVTARLAVSRTQAAAAHR